MINQIYQGDCLQVLPDFPSEWVDLVYLDPPFFTQKTQHLKSRDLVEYSFADTWATINAYISYLRERLIQVQRVMKTNATLFFHCDHNASHHIRLLLDEIFGAERFLSEIIWTYKRWSNPKRGLLTSHQTIFMYSKSEDYQFNELFQDYSETTNLDQILQKRTRNTDGKAVYALDETGAVILNGTKKGVPLSDTWELPFLNPKAKERTGYPTQKPLHLLERIIELSSQEGDLVLDPFCGSGTSCVAAKLLKRNYIGIDISASAVQVSQKRLVTLVKSNSPLLNKGREAYQNLPDEVTKLLATLPVRLVQRNQGIDAIYDEFINNQPIVLRVQRQGENLAEAAQKLKNAGQKKRAALMLLIQTQEHDLQASFLDIIPAEVILLDSLDLALQRCIISTQNQNTAPKLM